MDFPTSNNDDLVAFKSDFQPHLATFTLTLSARENHYRSLGLQYHSTPVSQRTHRSPAHKTCYYAFTTSHQPRIIARIQHLYTLRHAAKAALWKHAWPELKAIWGKMEYHLFQLGREVIDLDVQMKVFLGSLDLGGRGVRPAMGREEGYQKYEAFRAWIVELPEVKEWVKRRWGQEMGLFEEREAFGLAVTAVGGWKVVKRVETRTLARESKRKREVELDSHMDWKLVPGGARVDVEDRRESEGENRGEGEGGEVSVARSVAEPVVAGDVEVMEFAPLLLRRLQQQG